VIQCRRVVRILSYRCRSPCPYSALPELGHTRHVLDVLKLLAHLHDRISDQARIQTHCASQSVLCACTGVEAHDEVVAVVVGRLQFLRGLGEQEGAPVGVAAHDAALGQDDVACRFGDSGQRVSTPWVICERVGVAWPTLSLRRGGQAGPVGHCQLRSNFPLRALAYHSYHFIQHLAWLQSCPEVRCGLWLSMLSTLPPRKGSVFGQGTRPDPRRRLGAIISPESPPSAPHDCHLRLPLRHHHHIRNGRSIFCCPRCAPIDTVCSQETCTFCVPAMAAAGAKAAAILGICRVYVDRSCQKQLKITLARQVGADAVQ
jgi:hypothetical protein